MTSWPRSSGTSTSAPSGRKASWYRPVATVARVASALQVPRRGHQRRGRVLAVAQDGRTPVGDLGIVVDDQAQVLLVAAGGGEAEDLLKEVEVSPGPHAADDADGAMHAPIPPRMMRQLCLL